MILNANLEYFVKIENEIPKEILNIPSVLINLIIENNLEPTISIGFDTRIESKKIFDKVLEELVNCGLKIFIQDSFQSLPEFQFKVNQTNSSFGIYCNGGENPSGFSGVKIILTNKFSGKIDILRNTENFKNQIINSKKSEIVNYNAVTEYNSYLLSKINLEIFKKYSTEKPLLSGIIIDANGGATTTIIEDLLSQFEWRVHTIFSVPDNKFYSRVPNCLENNTEPLKFNVQTTNAIIGVIFNSTGSDCAFVSNSGNYFKKNKNDESILNALFVIEEIIMEKLN